MFNAGFLGTYCINWRRCLIIFQFFRSTRILCSLLRRNTLTHLLFLTTKKPNHLKWQMLKIIWTWNLTLQWLALHMYALCFCTFRYWLAMTSREVETCFWLIRLLIVLGKAVINFFFYFLNYAKIFITWVVEIWENRNSKNQITSNDSLIQNCGRPHCKSPP